MAAVDAHKLGRASDVALGLGELALDILPFVCLGGLAVRVEVVARSRWSFTAEDWQILGLHNVPSLHDDDPLDRVSELAHVTRPAVILHSFNRRRLEFPGRPGVRKGELMIEMFEQKRYI